MNLHRQLTQLNRQFAKFGYSPHGDLNYCWKHTSDLTYLLQTGHTEWRKSAAGVLTRQPVYKRHTWADTPHGHVWIIAQWTAPIPMDDWMALLGTSFPWPHRGQYNPIENMACHSGGCSCKDQSAPPDEFHTRGAVEALEFHLGHTAQELADYNMAQWKAHERSVRSEIESDLDDTLTAFGRIPGNNNGSTSIVSNAYRKRKEDTCQKLVLIP